MGMSTNPAPSDVHQTPSADLQEIMITITKREFDELQHESAELMARIAYLEEKLRWATVQRWFRERAAMQQSLTSCGSQVGHAI